MVQKRKTSTKEDIKEALIQLLSEERFDTISISKLCKRAGINRGTFYLHYQDKYQMIDSLKSDIVSQLYSFFEGERESPKKLLTANFHILRANERLINALTRSHYIDFRGAIREFITSIILIDNQKAATQRFLEENFHIPQKYALEIFLSSVEGIISLWIAGGAQEEPEEITQMILTTCNYDYWKS
ncbi:TetR/AcrR family transcriptional regulator [Streptococcus cristatus]|uniref:Transcriptional regulator, TetR family n=1 Tax=Streptococcus cristatus TaxID=45634 RepID=A0A139MZC6_STRCR|nr:TetR/AcrR family transcriptional regulator [Streptococcus cristatus]KXT68904.1 Transcriptional regulator, TetR family [Streptococcus cristatus]